jgi:chemotaxis protein MotB
MALHEEPDPGDSAPGWLVTYGDMMSLLLTFFIMLVSMSEVKQQQKYQAMLDSIRQRFGHDLSSASLIPGKMKPRNSVFPSLVSLGSARRLDLQTGGGRVQAPVGDYPRVRIVRPGSHTAVGTVVRFREDSARLEASQQRVLALQAEEMLGNPQKIEVRGHTSLRPPPRGSPFLDHWDLAYQRCRATMQFLVDQGIDARRIRLAVAGPHEPLHSGANSEALLLNSRVEVHVLDEVVKDLEGS